MDARAFTASLQSWHDFYPTVASAAAALLGLLFVGVSISLASLKGPRRSEVRDLANLAFSNLLYLLGLSLVVLIPTSDVSVVVISFAVIALLGLVPAGRRAIPLACSERRLGERWPALRRLGWTVVADLLLGAADVAWDLLVAESVEPTATMATPGRPDVAAAQPATRDRDGDPGSNRR